jgi:formylmethanofuran dehydrogenase subunit C
MGTSSSTGRVYIFTSQNGQVNTNVNLTGEATSNYFGWSLTSGDFNADGKTDLAVGATGYSTFTGRTYIFYNDGSIPTTAATADVIITGEASSYFGSSLDSGDLNTDGKTDLVVGAQGYSTFTGRSYIFYNDGSIPTTAATADVIITGETTYNYFSRSFTGDFNADGRTDLAVGASAYSTNTGRAYIFYNDGSIPTTAATADVIITGGASSNYFGNALTSGDFNADGKTDLAVGAFYYSGSVGRAYIFYNDGSIPTTAATADVIITGTGTSGGQDFGYAFASGDFNADGRIDLAVGAEDSDGSLIGSVYLFYNDGSIPTTAAAADVIISGEASSSFGCALTSGDFNADGRVDFAVGAFRYSSSAGRSYIFYNDGSIPTTAATADVMITGEASSNFGKSLTAGDFNADGKTDLVVGAQVYSTSTGRVYLYETRDNFAWQLQSQSSLSGGLRVNPGFSGQELKVTGEIGAGSFGNAMIAGDFNADGKIDLAVGASGYSSSTGRVYLFYNDGSIPAAAVTADVIITGETTSDSFGYSLTPGDFNADGKIDLAAGAFLYSSFTGRAYIFYNDGSIPTTAATADVIITGESSSQFGISMTSGDFNADGKADFVVGAYDYSSSIGRAYIFYNDGGIPITAATADVIITGGSSFDYFGVTLISGDFNADGRVDFAVGAHGYSTSTGRVYIFYNDGSIPTTAATADVIITGGVSSNYFGTSLASGDFNTDGKTDLVVGATGYSTSTGRTYIFYNDGSIPTTAATADVIITGETTSNSFSYSLTPGDFNADGKIDLAVGAYGYSSFTGRAYIFYNDGSIPTTAATADVIITGESSSQFGISMTSGDFNADGKADFVVGAYGYSSSRGRVYMYTFNDGVTTGETTNNYFGYAMTAGDFNADGKTDLTVGAYGYSTNTGRVYIFYNDGSVPTTAATADVVITGETTNNYFGYSLASGDFNADGKTDLAAGAYGYSSNIGRAYLFYNDGSIPTTAATADVIITATNYDSFGISLTAGDLNADGKTDIIAGADGYSGGTGTGRAYIFYADGTNNFGTAACTGSAPTACSVGNADVIITGESSSQFGNPLTSGDFNADGKTDLVVGAFVYSTNIGRAYIFYNDGSIPTTAATADVIITGEASSNFGVSLTSGDFNADGKTDLAVGAFIYSTSTGRAYIFYNDGSIPTTAATADIIITGETTSSYFGRSLASGDWNADSKTDLAVGAYGYSSSIGRVYIFYNDGSIPTAAASADVITTGQTTSNYFGYSLASGDFNADGKTDLAVGAQGYSTNTGRAYIFITEAKVEESIQQLKSKGTFKAKGSYQVK